MKAHHRGYEIEVTRDRTLGGDMLIFLCVMRESDGFICVDEPYGGSETVREMVDYMRQRIDAELAESDPWMERAEAGALP